MAKSTADKLLAEQALAALQKRKAHGKLTRGEMGAIKRYEAKRANDKEKALLASVPARRKSQASRLKSSHARRRRISGKYRPHMARIAELYEASGQNATRTQEVVRQRLGLTRFRACYVKKWLRVPEFAAIVNAEAELHASEGAASPFVRGPEKHKWLVEVERCMRETFDASEPKDPGRGLLLGAIHKVEAEIRALETHLDARRAGRARRSIGSFLKAYLRWLKRKGAPPVVWQWAEAGLANLDRLIGAATDLVDADAVAKELADRLAEVGVREVETGDAHGAFAEMSDEQLNAIIRQGEARRRA